MVDQQHSDGAGLARWQGGVDATLAAHEKSLKDLNGDSKAARQATEKILVEIAVLRTKIAVWSALGGFAGAAVVTLVVAVVTSGLPGSG